MVFWMLIDLNVIRTVDPLEMGHLSNKAEKEQAIKILKVLKLLIERPILHLDLSYFDGIFRSKNFMPYLTKDLEDLESFLIRYDPMIDVGLKLSINEFINFLIESYISVKQATIVGYGENKRVEMNKITNFTNHQIDRILVGKCS